MLDTPRPFPGSLVPRPSTVIRPGRSSLAPGCERYVVPGGGTLVVAVAAGDRLQLKDMEGRQPVELFHVSGAGLFDPGAFGAKPTTTGDGLKAALEDGGEGAERTWRTLTRRGIDVALASGLRIFGAETPAGTTAELPVTRDGLVLLCAVGRRMDATRQDTATPVELLIWRGHARRPGDAFLPEPLRDPRQDFRIGASTASAYLVKAGEFIQVIDVEGRQCTDFQAFALRKVDLGMDMSLDATVTRTLTGRSYPKPGLPSKAFDREFEPLVEIVQDTCGRHDAFATACNSRYYDDMGYPGHVNCTENFNRALEPYGIRPRKGWEALNYFYNTNIDQNNQLYLDEPWSRPGDYVLMRALTDLVCVSSSCPDDIDPANGWQPTDIHIRTYSPDEKFSRAVAYRMTPDAEPQLTRETAFHSRFSQLTRNYTEYRGYWLPSRFNNDGPIEEYWACRERAVVMDLSPLRKFEVTGPDAEALLQYCLTRDIRKLSTGQVSYTAMCYDTGGMIDDGTVFRLAQNNFRWIGGDEFGGLWLRQQAEKKGFRAWVRSSTDQLHNIALQGPKSRDILKDVVWTAPAQTAIAELDWFRFAVGRIGGFEGAPLVVSRTGYTGELGYEIFCHPKDAETVFDAIWQAGQPHGLRPMGLEALDMVRIEAGLIFARSEFTDQTDPFEAGIGFTVPLASKSEDFIGKAALIERKAHPRHVLVGLEIDANDAVGHGDCIHSGRAQVGVVTSGMRSPILKKNIALARVDPLYAKEGTALEVGKLDGHQKRLPATVTRFPHYDPGKTRPRA